MSRQERAETDYYGNLRAENARIRRVAQAVLDTTHVPGDHAEALEALRIALEQDDR